MKMKMNYLHFFVIILEQGEHFHKLAAPQSSVTPNATIDDRRKRLGHPNEFEDARRQWLAAQERRPTAPPSTTAAAAVAGGG